MSAQVAADLRAAAEVLRQEGWTQGAIRRKDGRRCGFGAICAVADDYRRSDAALILQRHVGGGIQVWNDTPGRTAAEVIAALEAAADAAEDKP